MQKLPDEMTTSQKYFDYVHKAEELIENMGWLQTGENIKEIVRDLILLDLVGALEDKSKAVNRLKVIK